MKEIKYGYYCEDSAIKIFLKSMLAQFPKELEGDISFTCLPHFDYTFKASSKIQMKKTFASVAIQSFKKGIDVFFVGIDYDLSDVNGHADEWNVCKALLPNELHAKTIIFLPVKTIEYWVHLLKQLKEKPSIVKPKEIEHMKSIEVKMLVYGTERVRTSISDPIVAQLSSDMDFSWLCNHSKSFNHFYKQLEAFVAAL